ncbi:MAG: hypothetical protein RI885_194 [Actinomycetota bacterium]|jgi:predicted Rdx family selenoprotein
MTPADAAEVLYGVSLATFIARRGELAAEATGADVAAIRSLPKPSAAAWVIDALMRADRAALEPLIALGDELRAAQAAGDRAALSALSSDRRGLVSEIAARAIDLGAEAGHRVSGSAAVDVAETLQAVVADRDAAAAARTGRLVRALRTAGFDGVDLSGAVAGRPPEPLLGGPHDTAPGETVPGDTVPGAIGTQIRSSESVSAPPARLSRAERLAQEREQAVADAVAALDHAAEVAATIAELTGDAEVLDRRRDDLESELEELADRVAELEEDLGAVDRDIRSLRSARERADRSAAAARRTAERAHRRLQELEEGV